MDQTDLKIISILQHNGRISMKDLGREVSLSPPAVAERVKRLEDTGVIERYKAVKMCIRDRYEVNAEKSKIRPQKQIQYGDEEKLLSLIHI